MDDVTKHIKPLFSFTNVLVVTSTEGVKFRVLCEEPGTALHLLMEVRAHECCSSCLWINTETLTSHYSLVCVLALSLTCTRPSSDQPTRVQHRGSDLPRPHLQLLPQRFLGSSGQEAVCWGADLPLEAQNHQEWLRDAKTNQRENQGDLFWV